MRALWLVAALVACGPGKSTGPAWPAPSTTAEDGGESIAPRPSASYAAAVERTEDVDDDKPVVASPTTSTPAASEDKPAASPSQPAQPTIEDVFMTEDIIIEIDE